MTARISLILREARAHRARLQLLFRSEDQLRHRKPCGITLFRVRFSWASLFRWYALKNARVPPAIVLSRLRRGERPRPGVWPTCERPPRLRLLWWLRVIF